MVKVKPAVRAQRKFAAGALVPASCAAPPVPPPPPQPDRGKSDGPSTSRTLTQNAIRPSTLLDYVALRNLHQHSQMPVVVLHRIEDVEQRSEVISVGSPSGSTSGSSLLRPVRWTRPRCAPASKRGGKVRKTRYRLRPRLSQPFPKTKPPRRKCATNHRYIKNNNNENPSSRIEEPSSEEDTPLQYLKKTRHRTFAAASTSGLRLRPLSASPGSSKVAWRGPVARWLDDSPSTPAGQNPDSLFKTPIAFKKNNRIRITRDGEHSSATKDTTAGNNRDRMKKKSQRPEKETVRVGKVCLPLSSARQAPVSLKRNVILGTKKVVTEPSTCPSERSRESIIPATENQSSFEFHQIDDGIPLTESTSKGNSSQLPALDSMVSRIDESMLTISHGPMENVEDWCEPRTPSITSEKSEEQGPLPTTPSPCQLVFPGSSWGILQPVTETTPFESPQSNAEAQVVRTETITAPAETPSPQSDLVEATARISSPTPEIRQKTRSRLAMPPPLNVSDPVVPLSGNANESSDFRMPESPKSDDDFKYRLPSVDIPVDTSPSLCPLERYTGLADVVNAPQNVLASGCGICHHCAFVHRCLEMIDVVNWPNVTTGDTDVYEIEEDGSTRLLQKARLCQLETELLDILGKALTRNNSVERTLTREEELKLVAGIIAAVKKSPGPQAGRGPAMSQARASTSGAPNPSQTHPGARRRTRLTKVDEPDNSHMLGPPLPGTIIDAPVINMTADDLKDPVRFFRAVSTLRPHGMFKMKFPPNALYSSSNIPDSAVITVHKQLPHRMFKRWGMLERLCACIRASAHHSGSTAPSVDGIEVNLPRLYDIVQNLGGLNKVIEKKRWKRVADLMGFGCMKQGAIQLSKIYLKYLLPYDAMPLDECDELSVKIDRQWHRQYRRMLKRAQNPFQRQYRLLHDSDESSESGDEKDPRVPLALSDSEDCVLRGSKMKLAKMKKIAETLKKMQLEPGEQSIDAIEDAYWKQVVKGSDHVAVYSASIDTASVGYGFPSKPDEPYSTHPWNAKMLSRNPKNILRHLQHAAGVTEPTINLGMLFTTACWYRDPHNFLWLEYLLDGSQGSKIWYSIPAERADLFREAVQRLNPASCQSKSVWLPSDILMIPPKVLASPELTLTRCVQEPGEYVVIFPEAYSSSICTGYCESESVYFADDKWFEDAERIYNDLRQSCEPTSFPLMQLLMNAARDPTSEGPVLRHIARALLPILQDELDQRSAIVRCKLHLHSVESYKTTFKKKANGVQMSHLSRHDECEVCRVSLYATKVIGISGAKSKVCAQHAVEMLRLRKYRHRAHSDVIVIVFISTEMLQESIDHLNLRLTQTAEQ